MCLCLTGNRRDLLSAFHWPGTRKGRYVTHTHLQRDGAVKDLASGDCGVVRRGVCAFFKVVLSRDKVAEGVGVEMVGGGACAITANVNRE